MEESKIKHINILVYVFIFFQISLLLGIKPNSTSLPVVDSQNCN
jgi:hypothetical protein